MPLTNASPEEAAHAASRAALSLSCLSEEARNNALDGLHAVLSNTKDTILKANAKDIELATKAAADGELSQSLIKRLDLSRPGKYDDMLRGIQDVRRLADPSMPPPHSATDAARSLIS